LYSDLVSLSYSKWFKRIWYYERPDILEYLQKAYKDVDIQFYLIILFKIKSSDYSYNNTIEALYQHKYYQMSILFASNDLTTYISENIHLFFTDHFKRLF
jgi:hypothetical protein